MGCKVIKSIVFLLRCHPCEACPRLRSGGRDLEVFELQLDSRRSLPSTPIGGGNDNQRLTLLFAVFLQLIYERTIIYEVSFL